MQRSSYEFAKENETFEVLREFVEETEENFVHICICFRLWYHVVFSEVLIKKIYAWCLFGYYGLPLFTFVFDL